VVPQLTSSVLVRALTFSAATALHVFAFAAFGHAPRPAAALATSAADIAVEEIVLPADEPTTDLTANVATRAPSAMPPTHHHSYPVATDHDARPHDPSLVHLPFPGPAAPHEEAAAAESVTEMQPSARFTMVVGSAPATARKSSSAGAAAADGRGKDDAPLLEGDVSSPARPQTRIAPAYPPNARAQGVEADVALKVVVSADGTVAQATIDKRAGFGFDEAVLAAVRTTRFVPARRDGRAVAVRMRFAYSFRLE
jgi:protein TonB